MVEQARSKEEDDDDDDEEEEEAEVSGGCTCGYAGRDEVALFVVGSECLEAVGRQALEER
jgi:hypothetical protein